MHANVIQLLDLGPALGWQATPMLRGRPGSPSGKREGVRVPVGATHAREDAAAAHQALEAGSTSGALLWRP